MSSSRGGRSGMLWAMLSLEAATACVLSGQTVVPVNDEPACESCVIGLDRVVTLVPPSARIRLTNLPQPSVTTGVEGRYYVGTMEGEAAIGVFDAAGGLIRTVGRFGDGPGELWNSQMFIRVGSGGEVRVFQRTRETTYSLGGETFLTTGPLEVLPRDVALVGGGAVVAALVRTPGGASTPVQVLDGSGGVLRGIGEQAARSISPSRPFDFVRLVAPAAAGGVWIAPLSRVEPARFDLEGREELRVVRETRDFRPYDDVIEGEGYWSRQRPRVEGVVEISEQVLLVAVSRGDPDFEPFPRAGSGGG